MKIKPHTISTVSLIALCVCFCAVSGFLYVALLGVRADISSLSARFETNEGNTFSLNKQIRSLGDGYDKQIGDIQKLLSSTTIKIEDVRKEATAGTRSAVANLTHSIEENTSSVDLPSIITKWSPFVAKIECVFESTEKNVDYLGSGFLETSLKRPFAHLVTNRHVVNLDGIKPKTCSVSLPGIKEKADISSNSIFIVDEKSTTTDVAFVDVANRVADIDARAAVNSYKVCSTEPRPGDRVVTIGYPSIGTKDGVTATDGIISGIEDKYYVTSAKVDAGNSGGIAILVEKGGNTCYLGIPTLVEVGRMESLGRILKASEIVE